MNLSSITEAGSIAARTVVITGKASDGAVAAGYGAWVQSITGSYPELIKTPQSTARIVHTKQQIDAMRRWVNAQARKKPDAGSTLQIELGPVIGPVIVQYAAAFAAGAFLVGWIGRGFFQK